ncbi:MAG: hypothetical protein CL676_04630 [Bdellovibrionaceae bacterium]|nr:hypothetical protein [Pseudobdellovibrionaceae bacterium]|tara:strand:+ start:13929 stop:14741 length:813 start_codon:yes stop_codon:yes gene_type:complete
MIKIIFSLFILLTSTFAFAEEESEIVDCRAAKEFATISEFLKKEKVFPDSDPQIQKTALEVISGCEGSAQRFIQVFQTLDKAGFVRKNALSTAINYAKKSDAQARMFCMVFQKAYLKKYLDLTAADAFKLAEELSNGSKDDKAPSASDFEKTVGFCIDDRRISLPRKFCADFAKEVAKTSGRYEEDLFDDLKSLTLWFMTRSSGRQTAQNALTNSFEIVQHGPQAKENFFRALEYIKRTSGFPLKPHEAISLAAKISTQSHTFKKADSDH